MRDSKPRVQPDGRAAGKPEHLFEIMKFGLEELERQVILPARAIQDAEARLRFIITTHARLVMRGDGAVAMLIDEARELSAPQYRRITRMKRGYFDLLRDTLDELRASGRMREINVTVAAFNILASVNWLPRWMQPDGSLTAGEIGEQIVDMTLNGVLRKPRRGLHAV